MITNSALAALKCALVLSLLSQSAWADTGNTLSRDKSEPISPIPLNAGLNQDKLMLGRLLFNDKRLSLDGRRSCASCHHLNDGGDDGLAVSPRLNNFSAVNTPSIYNTRFNFRQNWDGSAASLDEQLDLAVRKFSGNDSAWDELLARYNQDTLLLKRFSAIYQTKGITQKTYSDALVYYVESLTTPNARFDQYLRGDTKAINADELRGYTLFKEYGCITCHQGINVGGNLYQRFGIFYDYFRSRGNIKTVDYGRMNITGKSTDAHVFKVPSLRNIALTAPYLHDGQIKSLETVITVMGTTQLGVEIEKKDVALIVKFLKTLTGEGVQAVKEEL